MGKSRTQTTTQRLDPQSQAYVNQMRQMATAGGQQVLNTPMFTGPQTMSVEDQARAFFDPYMSNVVDGVRGEFDHLRGQASVAANQQATQAGAFGGSRAAIAQGARLGEIDRAQTGQIAGLMSNGWNQALQQGTQYAEMQRRLQEQKMQEPMFRYQQGLGMMNMGMGPTGMNGSVTTPGNLMGDIMGAGMVAGGLGAFGSNGFLANTFFPTAGRVG